jgi:hypothetical protein
VKSRRVWLITSVVISFTPLWPTTPYHTYNLLAIRLHKHHMPIPQNPPVHKPHLLSIHSRLLQKCRRAPYVLSGIGYCDSLDDVKGGVRDKRRVLRKRRVYRSCPTLAAVFLRLARAQRMGALWLLLKPTFSRVWVVLSASRTATAVVNGRLESLSA